MKITNTTKKHEFHPKINLKNKAYKLKDAALYNLTTKKKLSKIIFNLPISQLNKLAEDNYYNFFF